MDGINPSGKGVGWNIQNHYTHIKEMQDCISVQDLNKGGR